MRLHRSQCNAGTVLAEGHSTAVRRRKRLRQFLKRIVGNAGSVKPKDSERLEGIWKVVAQASSATAACEAPEATPGVPGQVYTDSAAPTAACNESLTIPLWLQADWGTFASDRDCLRAIVAWIRDNEGACLAEGLWQQRWSEYRRRVSESIGR